MKNQGYFASVILLGLGIYYFFRQSNWINITLSSWTIIFFVLGIAFLVQAYAGKDYEAILPGVIFSGLGVHFFIESHFNTNFNLVGVVILFVSLGYFLRAQKVKNSSFFAYIFLVLALLLLFYNQFLHWLGMLEAQLVNVQTILPLLLIIVGLYIFFFKRK